MEVFNNPSKTIVACNSRLAPYLEREIRQLGFAVRRTFATGVELEATVNDCIRLNLNLRCANQVRYSLIAFRAKNPDELYAAVTGLPWESLIADDGYVSVTSTVRTPTVTTPLFANVKVKDAIADRIKRVKGRRPDSGPELDRAVVYLYWQDDRAELFLDTSGESLTRHGYRKHPGKAPMQETLAAGVVMATAWDGKTPFINPMCGSGTLAIEAALLATNRAPGLLRMNYAFMHFLGYDETVFFAERRQLKTQIRKQPAPRIIASDISTEAVDIARLNARTAGVEQLIEFRVCDFADTPLPEGPGVVVFNPAYGDRLGEHSRLEATYGRIGHFLKQQCAGKNGYVFTGNPDLAKKVGLRPLRRIEFYNGKLDCRLLEYALYTGTRRAVHHDGD